MKLHGDRGERPGRVLVVVGSAGMGDGVEALPTFEMIRAHWPGVHLAAGYFRDKQKAILETCSAISEQVPLRGGVRYISKTLKALVPNVKAMRGYDTVLFLHKTPSIAWPMLLAARLAGTEALYKHPYRYSEERRNAFSDFPESVLFQLAAASLLLREPLTRLKAPTIFLSERDDQFAQAFFDRSGLGARPVVLINTQSGYRGSHPDWGIEKYARVAKGLVDWGADVIINGGEPHQIRQFRRVQDQVATQVTLLESPKPRELAAVIRRCDLYLGSTSGPASVAMAVGIPTIILVGPGDDGYPAQGRIGPVWWPRDPKHRVISKVDLCSVEAGCTCRPGWSGKRRVMKRLGVWRPWKKMYKKIMKSWGIYRHAATSPLCFNAIGVDEVIAAAIEHLKLYGVGFRASADRGGSAAVGLVASSQEGRSPRG